MDKLVIHGYGEYDNAKVACDALDIDYSNFKQLMSVGEDLVQKLYKQKSKRYSPMWTIGEKYKSLDRRLKKQREEKLLELYANMKKQSADTEDDTDQEVTLMRKIEMESKVDKTTALGRMLGGVDVYTALLEEGRLFLKYVTGDGKAHYNVGWYNESVTTRDIVAHYRCDLLEEYDKENPKDWYVWYGHGCLRMRLP